MDKYNFQVLGNLTTVLVVATNSPLIFFTAKQQNRTFLDNLVILDCCLCIVNMGIITIHYLNVNANISACIIVFLPSLHIFCNRFLTVSIVIYRYILVLHPAMVDTALKRRILESLILAAIFLLPLVITAHGVYHRNHYYYYLGRQKEL